MVTTITLNPMLDKTVHIERFVRGAIHRATAMELVAGGKGVNVARQLKVLGIDSQATGFMGGEVGSIVLDLLRQEGIRNDFVQTDSPTREGVTYLEVDGTSTAVFEPAQKVPLERVHELSEKFHTLFPQNSWIVCSGSSPGSEADDLYYEAVLAAHKYGVMSILDSYGEPFRLGLKAVPSLVKPNKDEFEQTFGGSLQTDDDFVKALNHLLGMGIQYAIVTDSARPCYAAIKGHYWKLTPPAVRTVNPVGSGDAMVAGIVYGFHQGWKFQQCVSFGIAAGAANAQKWGVANSELQEILSLEQQTRAQRLR